jgi:CDP-diacylglycerol---glycerol-3-phosphate 3-phosphatidyltransferase
LFSTTLPRLLRWTPWALVAFRVAVAPALSILLLHAHVNAAAVLFVLAVLSDIFDGVIARRLGVATLQLRLADSYADMWLYLWFGSAILLALHAEVAGLAPVFFLMLGLQLCSWGFCLWRFRRWCSYHSWLSKLTGLLLGAGILVLLLGGGVMLLGAALWVFALAAAEEIAMTAVLQHYHHDVRHLGQALRLRRVEERAQTDVRT